MAKLFVHLDKIAANLKIVKNLCSKSSMDLAVVTKCCGLDSSILNHVIENGADMIAESHPANFRKINDNISKISLLTPISALKQDVFCNYLFISELKILETLSSLPLAKSFQVIIPIEVGDMREGVPPEQLLDFMNKALKIKTINITGFSANFGCFIETSPNLERIDSFIRLVKDISDLISFYPRIISIGGSSLWPLLKANKIPEQVTQIRIGEAIFLGKDPGRNCCIDELFQDTFTLESEILEIKNKYINAENYFKGALHCVLKTSKPKQHRAVIDIGYTTSPYTELIPIQPGIKIIGNSQDYTVIDTTNIEKALCVGDIVKFYVTYKGLARIMTADNSNLEKIYI